MERYDDFFSCLNTKQREVVNELDGNILLLASAGTGKTKSISSRIVNIINNKRCQNEEILCLTFTNRGCKEMKESIIPAIKQDGSKIVIKTFHSFCFDIIKKESRLHDDITHDFVIFDEEDCKEIIKDIVPLKYSSSKIQQFIDYIKIEKLRLGFSDYKDVINYAVKNDLDKLKEFSCDDKYRYRLNTMDLFIHRGHTLVEDYNNALKDSHGLDFNDLLIKTSELFNDESVVNRWLNKFKYIHIDEVQDTSEVEYRIISKLFKGNKIMMCGDYFQTIYEWRGSNPKDVLSLFKNEYDPKTIVFHENYRSTQKLLDASFGYLKNVFGSQVDNVYNHNIKPNSNEIGEDILFKTAVSFKSEGEWIYNKIKELNIDDITKIAVLTRNNRVNANLCSLFKDKNSRLPKEKRINFLLVDEYKFFRRQEIKDITAYLKLILNRFDNNSLKRIARRFYPGIWDKTLESIDNEESMDLGIRLVDLIDINTHRYCDPYMPLINELEKGNLVVFDVESTGVDTLNDEIIQIAAIKINLKGDIIDEFQTLVKPEKSVGASEYIHGFSDEHLALHGLDKLTAIRKFLKFIDGSLLLGHNIGYDLAILSNEVTKLGLDNINGINYFDTLDMSRRFYPNLDNHKLETLSNFFNTSVEPDHNAINDIIATKDILIKIINEKIKPNMMKRISIYTKDFHKFAPVCDDIGRLRNLSQSLRPHELIHEVVKMSKIEAVYKEDEGRINYIRELYYIARDVDDLNLSPENALIEFLKLTSLSNSELDRLLEKYPRIPIITIHQAKGSEFDYVFLAGLQEYIFPSYPAIKSSYLDEEKRVFYVALTRAKKQLFMSWSKYDEKGRKTKSRFISEIPKEFLKEIQ